MREVNVLSIDFDYFQDAPDYVIQNCYPPEYDGTTEQSIREWAKIYKIPELHKHLQKVKINQSEYKNVLKIIASQNVKTISQIQNSHVGIYNFVLKQLKSRENVGAVNIYNLDMHHDMLNDNSHLDCGNWISYQKKRN